MFTSNDPEELISRCGEDLNPLSHPLRMEEFLVQSRGMSSWLKLKLADKLGIFANTKFRFPEETIWMILKGFRDSVKNPYTKEGMAWKIFDLLPGLLKVRILFLLRLPDTSGQMGVGILRSLSVYADRR